MFMPAIVAPQMALQAPASWGGMTRRDLLKGAALGAAASQLRRWGFGDINTVAAVIQRVEGYYPPGPQYPQGTLAWRNNNPGSLRYVGQPDASPGEGGFASFPSYDSGYNALKRQIQIQSDQGQTLSQFINQYAPPADKNDTSKYLSTLESATGYSGSDSLAAVLSGGASTPVTIDTTALTADSSGDWSTILNQDIGGGMPAWSLAIPAALLAAYLFT